MTEDSKDPKKKQGIDVDNINFDEDGEANGLDDDILDSIAGGLQEDNGNCPCNSGC